MTNGYQQFFKKAQEAAVKEGSARRLFPKAKIRFSLNDLDNTSKEQAPRRSKSTFSQEPAPAKENKLAGDLRKRLKQKVKKRSRKMPVRLILTSLVGVAVSAGALWKSELIEKYAKNIEISVMGYASAEEATPQKSETAKTAAVAPAASDATGTQESVSKKEFSEEEINHFAKLNERKRELDAREEELNRMEQELAKQKTNMEKRLKELESTRRQISSVLEEKVQADDKKVDSLVQVYSNMKPQQAAKIFETMDEDLAIEILGRMKKKPAAEILNLVKAEKAQVLSEKYAGYKRP
jgi:flagellar motility protein MotE (MotC chaperone)